MKYFGYAMLAAPFVAVFAFAAVNIGVPQAIGIFCGVALLLLWIYYGTQLAIR